MYSPFSRQSMPRHQMQQQAPVTTPGTPPQYTARPPEDQRGQRRDPMSFGDRMQNWTPQNWVQQMQNNPMQQFMGPGSKYAQMIGSNPYLSQLQNIPFLGSLFGAPMQSIPGMNQQPQQPQIGGPLPPTGI